MTELTKYQPRRTMQSIQGELRDLFSDFFMMPWGVEEEQPSAVWAPRMDLMETPDAYEFKIDLPGIAKEDLSIDVEGNRLTIRGERKLERREEDGNVLRMERSYGRFYRTVRLPSEVRADEAAAKFDSGVLTVRVPKTETSEPKKIAVE